jgi:Fe-S cluster assembly ATP-binding protein
MPDQALCQYLNKVGLCAGDYVDREVDGSLSGGEVKRIEIATILARKSPLMIFDEPEAGIDLWSFSKLTETFRALHKRRESTIIVISHQERIIDLADEIIVLSGGAVEKRGPKDEILPSILADAEPMCRFQPREVLA